jgi:hypothetical protein
VLKYEYNRSIDLETSSDGSKKCLSCAILPIFLGFFCDDLQFCFVEKLSNQACAFYLHAVSDYTSDDLGDKPAQFSSWKIAERQRRLNKLGL